MFRLLVAFVLIAPVAGATHVPVDDIAWACGFGGGGQTGHPDRCGIDPIHDPVMSHHAWLDGDELVLGIVVGGDARAYPVKVLNRHEIVNDVVEETPVAITFCPLCGSGVTFERQLPGGGEIARFSASGFLYRHDLVMHDDVAGLLWTQIRGQAIASLVDDRVEAGHADVQLKRIPTAVVAWGDWLAEHPDSVLLQVDGSYEIDPYARGGYYTNCEFGISGGGACNVTGLHPKQRVVAAEIDGQGVAFALFALDGAGGVATLDMGGRTVVARSGPAGASLAVAPGLLRLEGGVWMDEANITWDLLTGRSGLGETLQLVDSMVLFWFAWDQHVPGSLLWNPDGLSGAPGSGAPTNGAPAVALATVAAALLALAWVWRRR